MDLSARRTAREALTRRELAVAGACKQYYPDMWAFPGEEAGELVLIEDEADSDYPAAAFCDMLLPDPVPMVVEEQPGRGLNELAALAAGNWFVYAFSFRPTVSLDPDLSFEERIREAYVDPDVTTFVAAKAEERAIDAGAQRISIILPLKTKWHFETLFDVRGYATVEERSGYYSLGIPVVWRLVTKGIRRVH